MDKQAHETTERRLENLIFYRYEVQNKYVYYLLAINVACIAFTINFTKDSIVSFRYIPLGFAIFFWGLSFYFGISQIQNHECGLQLNINELSATVKGEKIPESVKEKQLFFSKRGAKHRKYQNYFIFIGAICFIIWYFLIKI